MTNVADKFTAIGARLSVDELPNFDRNFSIDYRRGRFDVRMSKNAKMEIVDLNKPDKHLLLMVKLGKEKQRYLCGHDERDFFVAAVPGNPKSVSDAKEALKPQELRTLESTRVKTRNKHKRHRKLSGVGKVHRQGEFMFVPAPNFRPDELLILKNEPMTLRAGGKPHVAQELVRIGGQSAYVFRARVLTEKHFRELQEANPQRAKRFQPRRINPTAYVRGTIRHKDHATVKLRGWHKVLVSDERRASFSKNVDFID